MVTLFKKRICRWFDGAKRISAAEARRLQELGVPVEKRTFKSRKWYTRLRLPNGRYKEVPLYTDKTASQAKALELLRQLEREAAGVINPADRYLRDDWRQHLSDYATELRHRGNTEDYIRKTCRRIERVFERGFIRCLGDIQAAKVMTVLEQLREDDGLSIETVNHYAVAVKMFSRWLWRDKRLPDDPLVKLQKSNAEADRRHVRRALTQHELHRLILAAEASPVTFRGLDGRTRAVLYALAASTGLRAKELASLTAADLILDVEKPSVTVAAAYTKNRDPCTQPLPPDVATYVRSWLGRRRGRTRKLFPGTWYQKAANMIRRDLEAAGIPIRSDDGLVDFHSLRLTFATELGRNGVILQTAQKLMRHSTPKLTASLYTKLGFSELSDTVARLRIVPLNSAAQAYA